MVKRTLALLLAMTSPAAAWVTGDAPVTDYSAFARPAGEWRVGLFRAGYAFTDWLQVDTLTLPYVLRAITLDGKASHRISDTWSISANLGLVTWSLRDLPGASDSAADVRLIAAPIGARSTWVLGDWGLTAGASYTSVQITGDADADAADLDATGAVSTAQLTGAIEWRRSRNFAWVLEGRALVWEDVRGDAKTVTRLDDDTDLIVHGDASVDLGDSARGNFTLSAVWSYAHFNVRVGGGYGHYSLPLLATFLPDPTFVPEFDLYWRF